MTQTPLSLGAPIKHLLVDLDGTLLGNRNIPLSINFVREALFALRKHGSIKQVLRALLAINREFNHPSADMTNDHRVVALFAEKMNLSLEDARQLLRDGVATVFPGLKKHFFPIPGAKDFLEWAKDRYPLTLATNPVWPPNIVELRLQWAGIDPSIFGMITHIRNMRACKPSQEYYSQILQDRGLKPEECLLIGDGMKMDLPATRVGIRVFIVGHYKQTLPLKISGMKASAWKGSYPALKALLNEQLEAGKQA